MPLGDMLRRSADRCPEKTAVICDGIRMPYRELNERVNRLANRLLETGVQKGDRVAVVFHNCREFVEVYFACSKSGAVFVPINNLLKEGEFVRIIQYVEPRWVMLDPDYRDLVERLLPRAQSVENCVVLGGGAEATFQAYEALLAAGSPEEPRQQISDDDLMCIWLTSGTTGLPKGAMRSHRQNVFNAMTGVIELQMTPEDRGVLFFPLYHVTWEDHLRFFLMGNTVYIRREGAFDPEEVLGILSREKITISWFVPTMINALLQVADFSRYDLGHLRLITYAAAPMPVDLLKRAMGRFQCRFAQFYGQTETGPMTTLLKPEDHIVDGTPEQVARLASSGRPVLTFELRIVGPNGTDVAPGEVGEIIVRSESTIAGYWNLPEETAKTVRDGWVYTGDFGRFDDEKYVYIVDRKNDMIISGGKNIYPRELEEVIYTHRAVFEVAVIGVPDEYWGEAVKAVVVLKEGMSASEEEIIRLCKDNLAGYKKPRSVEFRKELPKTPSGKVLKREIRSQFWKGQDRNV